MNEPLQSVPTIVPQPLVPVQTFVPPPSMAQFDPAHPQQFQVSGNQLKDILDTVPEWAKKWIMLGALLLPALSSAATWYMANKSQIETIITTKTTDTKETKGSPVDPAPKSLLPDPKTKVQLDQLQEQLKAAIDQMVKDKAATDNNIKGTLERLSETNANVKLLADRVGVQKKSSAMPLTAPGRNPLLQMFQETTAIHN